MQLKQRLEEKAAELETKRQSQFEVVDDGKATAATAPEE